MKSLPTFVFQLATFLLAVPMLRERFGGYRVFISAIMITGVLLITRPPALFPEDPYTPSPNTTQPNPDPYSNNQCRTHENVGSNNSSIGYIAAIFVPILSAVVSIWNRICQSSNRNAKKTPIPVLMFWFANGTVIVAVVGEFLLKKCKQTAEFAQCEIVRTFLLLRFYVKSILLNLYFQKVLI